MEVELTKLKDFYVNCEAAFSEEAREQRDRLKAMQTRQSQQMKKTLS